MNRQVSTDSTSSRTDLADSAPRRFKGQAKTHQKLGNYLAHVQAHALHDELVAPQLDHHACAQLDFPIDLYECPSRAPDVLQVKLKGYFKTTTTSQPRPPGK